MTVDYDGQAEELFLLGAGRRFFFRLLGFLDVMASFGSHGDLLFLLRGGFGGGFGWLFGRLGSAGLSRFAGHGFLLYIFQFWICSGFGI